MRKHKHVYIDGLHAIFLEQTKVILGWVTGLMVARDVQANIKLMNSMNKGLRKEI